MAPSPKNETATVPRFIIFEASAAPAAIGIPPPTTPFAPRFPVSTSAMCIDPPRPPQ